MRKYFIKCYFGNDTFTWDFPNKLDIGTGHVDVDPGARSQRVLTFNSPISKQHLKSFIFDKKKGKKMGFIVMDFKLLY